MSTAKRYLKRNYRILSVVTIVIIFGVVSTLLLMRKQAPNPRRSIPWSEIGPSAGAPIAAQPATPAPPVAAEEGALHPIKTPEGDAFLAAYNNYDATNTASVKAFESAYKKAKEAGVLRFSDKIVNEKTGATVWYGALAVLPYREGLATSSILSTFGNGWNNCSYGGDAIPNTACFVLYRMSSNGLEHVVVPEGGSYPIRFIGNGVLLGNFYGEGGFAASRYGYLDLEKGTAIFIGVEEESGDVAFSNNRTSLLAKAEPIKDGETTSTVIVFYLLNPMKSSEYKWLLSIPIEGPYTGEWLTEANVVVDMDVDRMVMDPMHRIYVKVGERTFVYDDARSRLEEVK